MTAAAFFSFQTPTNSKAFAPKHICEILAYFKVLSNGSFYATKINQVVGGFEFSQIDFCYCPGQFVLLAKYQSVFQCNDCFILKHAMECWDTLL